MKIDRLYSPAKQFLHPKFVAGVGLYASINNQALPPLTQYGTTCTVGLRLTSAFSRLVFNCIPQHLDKSAFQIRQLAVGISNISSFAVVSDKI